MGLLRYRLIHGVVELGTWKVADAVKEQPWLPNGPIPTVATWSLAAPGPTTPADNRARRHGVPA